MKSFVVKDCVILLCCMNACLREDGNNPIRNFLINFIFPDCVNNCRNDAPTFDEILNENEEEFVHLDVDVRRGRNRIFLQQRR